VLGVLERESREGVIPVFKKPHYFERTFVGITALWPRPVAVWLVLQCSGKVPSDRWFDVVVGRFSPHTTRHHTLSKVVYTFPTRHGP